jgi:hypothetical protein
MEKKKFKSRISGLLVVVILATLIPIAVIIITGKTYPGFYFLGGITLFFIFLIGGMRYIISGEKLCVKCGLVPGGSKKIKDIVSIKRSYNPLSSPAASFKRLSIHFKKGMFWLVSPVREKEFIEALKVVNPDIDVHIPEEIGKWRIWDWDIYK